MKKSYIRIEGRIILKIKVLEYFITLAESQSINEAAGKLYIAQPSLTKALQLFEAEIGTQLQLPLFRGNLYCDAARSAAIFPYADKREGIMSRCERPV